MNIRIIIFTLSLISFSFLHAQNNTFTISGKIIDKETKLPLEYATVSIINSENNSLVDGTITDTKGKFSINIPTGIYNIKIEFISYETIEINHKQISSNLNLGEIALGVDLESLDTVEIIAKKTTVELKLDKKVYNVGKDLTVSGGNVSDVLDNVPSVSIDQDGAIALRGNDNVRILINGKPSGLVGLDSSEALQQLPAESIEKVEVITSPSARYDAEGAAGIINIILRRSKIQGLNGSVTANTGYPYAAGIATNLNYRTGDINIFNTSSYRYREHIGKWYNDVDYFDPNTPDLNEQRRWTNIHNSITTNTGIEWYITDKTSLTNSFFYRDNNTNTSSINTIERVYEVDGSEDTIIRASPRETDNDAIQYALNFTNTFDKTDHKFSLDFQYEESDQNRETQVNIDDFYVEDAFRKEDRRSILIQTDYILPIGKSSQFEIGYRGTFDKTITDLEVFTIDTNTNTFTLEDEFSSLFDFQQDINAVYTQFGSKINKFSYLIGIRYEGTTTIIDQPEDNFYDKELLDGLFPTVNLNYEIDDEQSFTLGYNRRISRPSGFMLNPFPSRSSTTDIFQGNPGINPSFTSSFELGYLNSFGEFTLSSALYFSDSEEVITFASFRTGDLVNIRTGLQVEENDPTIPDEDKSPVVERSPVNIDTEERYGLEFNLNYSPIKNWRINIDFNIFKFLRWGNYQGVDLSANDVSWRSRLTNKLKLPYDIEWQTNLNYRGPREDAQNQRKGRLRANMALSKDFLNDKASILFNVSDIFNSAYQSRINTDTFTSFRELQFRGGRIYNLAFTYRFNQKKKRDQGGEHSGDIDF